MHGVACVTAEKLVATVAGQHALDPVGASELRAAVRWQRRRVAERLVVGCGNGRDAAHQVVRRHVVLVVLGAEVARSDAREFHLVVASGVEADRVGAGGTAGDAPEHARHGGTVGAAAQEAAHACRVYAGHLRAHAVFDEAAELVAQPGEGAPVLLVEGRCPVGLYGQLAILEHRAVPGGQPVNAAEHRARRRDDVEEEVVEEGLRVEVGRAISQRVGTFSKAQLTAIDAVAQRACGEAVHGHEHAAKLVAQRHRKVAGHLRGCQRAAAQPGLLPRRLRPFARGQIGQARVGKARSPDAEAGVRGLWWRGGKGAHRVGVLDVCGRRGQPARMTCFGVGTSSAAP